MLPACLPVMLGLDPSIHANATWAGARVDGRVRPGHDGGVAAGRP
jgi:hypothetical protein